MLCWESLFEENRLISSCKSCQTMGASKAKVFFFFFFFFWGGGGGGGGEGIYVQKDRIEEAPRIFYLDGFILYYIFHNE